MARRDALLRLHQSLTARCVALRKSLADEVEALHRFRTEQTGDCAAAAFDCDGEEVSVRLAELEARELAQIERALTRLKQGTYSVCEACGGKIPVARLNALPYSTTCVECQREIEGRPGPKGRRREGWERVCDAGPAESEQTDPAKLEMELSRNP